MALGAGARAAIAGGAVIVLAGAWLLARDSRAPTAPSAPSVGSAPAAATKALTAEECAKSLVCTAPKFAAEAGAPCRKAIEDLAAYAPRWAQAGTDRMFRDYAWLDQARGTITFQGNEAEFQNASGLWQPVAYECDYDPAAHAVLGARAKGAAGR